MVLFAVTAYGIFAGQKFCHPATATLVGGCLRIPYPQATRQGSAACN